MAKDLENCFFNKGVQGPTRQRPDFAKRSTLIVDCTKNMLSVPDKEISQSIQHNKEGKILNNNLMNTRSTPKRSTLELDGNIILQQVRPHPRSGSRTMNGSRHKVGSVGDLQPGLISKKILKVEIISTGGPVAWGDSDSIFSCSGSCFSLAGNFQFTGNPTVSVNRTPSHTSTYRCAHFVRTSRCTHSLYHIFGSRSA